MSGLMGAIGQGLSAAGYSAGDLYAKGSLMDAQNALEEQRMMRLAEFRDKLDQQGEARKRAPLNRLQGLMAAEAGADVPVEAAPVTRLSGAGAPTHVDGSASSGLRGDPEAIRRDAMAQLAKMPEGPAKDEVIASFSAQFGKQFATDMQSNRDAVAGQTRKRTPDEAFDAAMGKAKTTDLEAYAAGKPLQSEKTITVPDGATVLDKNGKVIFSASGIKDARQNEHENRLDARMRESQAASEARQQAGLIASDERQANNLKAQEERQAKALKAQQDRDAERAAREKALPVKLANDLGEQAQIADTTERVKNTFKPEFANKTITGEGSNVAKRVFGDESGQAQWWQDYALHETTVRHKLFGASLTPGEQGQWLKLTVTPRMDSAEVEKNLARRAEIEGLALNRMMNMAVAAGYNREQVEAATGRPIPGGSGAASNTPGAKPNGAVRITSQQQRDSLPPGTEYIAPDGSIMRKK